MDWIASHGSKLGRVYANELDRHYRPAHSRDKASDPGQSQGA